MSKYQSRKSDLDGGEDIVKKTLLQQENEMFNGYTFWIRIQLKRKRKEKKYSDIDFSNKYLKACLECYSQIRSGKIQSSQIYTECRVLFHLFVVFKQYRIFI